MKIELSKTLASDGAADEQFAVERRGRPEHAQYNRTLRAWSDALIWGMILIADVGRRRCVQQLHKIKKQTASRIKAGAYKAYQ